MEILARNCRIPHSVIGRSVQLSKDAVANRIQRLEEQNLLGRYVLFIDARKLGFTRYHLLVRFESDVVDKHELSRKATKHPAVMWVNTFIGQYDVQIILDAESTFELERIRKELFALMEHRVQKYAALTHLYDFEFTQLNPVLDLGTGFETRNDSSFSGKLSSRSFPVQEDFSWAHCSARDARILDALADDPAASISQLARELDLDRRTIKSRIDSLIDDGVILSFGGIPDLSEMGFVTYYLLVRLDERADKQLLQKPFSELRNIFYAGKMLGDYDMILYLNARTPQELDESIEVFTSQIGKHILNYDLLVQNRLLHWRQFTRGIYSVLIDR